MKNIGKIAIIILALSIGFIQFGFICPKVNAKVLEASVNLKDSEEVESVIQKFIPKEMQLSPAIDSKRGKAIIRRDIDKDGEKEIVFTFESLKERNKCGIIVLKKEKDSWKEILKDYDNNNCVYKVYFKDIDGDKIDELLVSYSSGKEEEKSLKVYKFDDKKTVLKLIGEEKYDKIYMKDMPNCTGKCDKKIEIALWNKDIGDAYEVKVIRYNGKKFVKAEDVYSHYYGQVIDYYRYKLRKKENKDSALMWYYLIDAQMKAGKSKEALSSIYDAKRLNLEGYEKVKDRIDKLEKKALESFK